MPPPRTRENSGEERGMRGSVDVVTDESSTGVREKLAGPEVPGREARWTVWVRLFHVPQREHRPSQRGVVAPHSLQT